MRKSTKSVCVCARAPLCVCEKTLLPVVGGLEVEWMRRSEESRLSVGSLWLNGGEAQWPQARADMLPTCTSLWLAVPTCSIHP